MRKYAWTLFVVGALATTGCNQAELKKALADAKSAEAQKDSLLTEVLETTQFVTDINGELAKAKSLAMTTTSTDPGLPGARKDREDRKAALQRVNSVIAKLNESEAKLAETETGPRRPGSGTRGSWPRSRPTRRRSTTSAPPPRPRRQTTSPSSPRPTPRSPRWRAGWTR